MEKNLNQKQRFGDTKPSENDVKTTPKRIDFFLRVFSLVGVTKNNH